MNRANRLTGEPIVADHRLMTYLWERTGWPNLRYDSQRLLTSVLTQLAAARASLLARVDATGIEDRNNLALQAFHDDALGTACIEGEKLPSDTVRSSVARRLGLDGPGASFSPALRNVEGLIEVMDDATREHARPLTKERLLGWHAALFPTGYSHLVPITVGTWRTEGSTV